MAFLTSPRQCATTFARVQWRNPVRQAFFRNHFSAQENSHPWQMQSVRFQRRHYMLRHDCERGISSVQTHSSGIWRLRLAGFAQRHHEWTWLLSFFFLNSEAPTPPIDAASLLQNSACLRTYAIVLFKPCFTSALFMPLIALTLFLPVDFDILFTQDSLQVRFKTFRRHPCE